MRGMRRRAALAPLVPWLVLTATTPLRAADPPVAAAAVVPEADLALRAAVRAGDAAGVARAAGQGGRPDQTAKLGVSLLQQAAAAARADVVAALLAAGATVDLRSSLGETPLHAAVEGGSLEIVDRLLAAGADPNARMKYGRTPLVLAAELDSAAVARRLIEGGARVGDAAKYGVTPLHVAAGRGADSTARVLLEAGADPLARDADGDTPFDVARRAGHAGLADRLAARTPAAARRVEVDPAAAVADLTQVDFRNREHRLDGSVTVRLRDGVSVPARAGEPEVFATTVLLGTLGDRPCAAVLLRWDTGGGDARSTLILYGLDAGGHAVERARLPPIEGRGGALRGARFDAGELVVSRARSESPGGPERLEVTRYRWDGAGLAPVAAPERPPLR